MKNIITLAVLFISLNLFAQVGINNTSPKATLDITPKTTDGSKPEGLLIPQLDGNSLKTASYGTSQKGVIVYAKSAANPTDTKTVNVTAEGYYYFDGSVWQKMTGASAADATTTAKGIVQLAGDLTGTAASPSIASSAVTSAKIADGTVANVDLASGAGGIYKGSGSLSGNTTVTQGTNTLAFSSSATNGFSVAGQTLSIDGLNSRVGIGIASPTNLLDINGDGINSPARFRNIISESAGDSNYNLVVNSNGEIKKSQKTSIPMYFQKYVLSNVNYDWVDNYDTKIPSNKYTLVIVGANFPYTLNTAGGTSIEAYVSGGTWRIRADFSGATTSPSVNGTWTISTLILDNSQVIGNPDISKNMGGSNSGAAVGSPVP